MAADNWKIYEPFKAYMGQGLFNLNSDDVTMTLHSSASNAATLSNGLYGDLTNELSTANGYVASTGINVTGLTYTQTSGVATLDIDDPAITASGGSLVFRFGVLSFRGTFSNVTGSVARPLIAYCLFDNTPADITVTDGNTFTALINASGVFQLSGGTT